MATRYRAAFRRPSASAPPKSSPRAWRAASPRRRCSPAATKTASSSPRRRRSFQPTASSVIGVIQLAQTADRWLTLRDRALTRLLNLTLFVTLFAVGAAFWFAGRMTLRISRLGAASETALGREGNLSRVLPESDAQDELGDLSRSFSSLLGRLDEYTGYLRTLAGKLAHEIRTPLTIIRSSLENLESEDQSSNGMGDNAKVYLARAREGSERLGAILTAMGAATRVEEAIAHSERQRFDLAALVRAAVGAYGSAFPQRRFRCEVPDEAVEITGAPDLIVQMLDKLIDNAVDFSADGATISVVLRADAIHAELSVANPGPPLPPETATRLFESLWQSSGRKRQTPAFRPRAVHRAADCRIPWRRRRGRQPPRQLGRRYLRLRLPPLWAPSVLRKFSRYSSQERVCRAIETLWRERFGV